MPHTYTLQNVPSHVAAGEACYRQLLAQAAEARRFAPEGPRQSAHNRPAGAALLRATRIALVRLGVWLHGVAVPRATDPAP
jgi:hypothetical protein